MNLAGVISDLSTGSYTVTRRAAGSYSSGRFVPGSTSTLSITASVQPLSGRDLMRLPEGERSSERLRVYTATALQTAAAPGGAGADSIAIGSDNWQVETVEAWDASGNFYKAIVRKVQP